MTFAICRTSWFYSLHSHSQEETNFHLSSRMDKPLLSESNESISLLNVPTFMMIIQTFSVCNQGKHDTTKLLTIANESKLPIMKYLSVTCFSSLEKKSDGS